MLKVKSPLHIICIVLVVLGDNSPSNEDFVQYI